MDCVPVTVVLKLADCVVEAVAVTLPVALPLAVEDAVCDSVPVHDTEALWLTLTEVLVVVDDEIVVVHVADCVALADVVDVAVVLSVVEFERVSVVLSLRLPLDMMGDSVKVVVRDRLADTEEETVAVPLDEADDDAVAVAVRERETVNVADCVALRVCSLLSLNSEPDIELLVDAVTVAVCDALAVAEWLPLVVAVPDLLVVVELVAVRDNSCDTLTLSERLDILMLAVDVAVPEGVVDVVMVAVPELDFVAVPEADVLLLSSRELVPLRLSDADVVAVYDADELSVEEPLLLWDTEADRLRLMVAVAV